ncbi:MAG TPA: tetratricopeptide repeat protein, partial [Gemmatales bacterium]|nr:tetratricopeptide repeat protein [Gemmatales bacterium]
KAATAIGKKLVVEFPTNHDYLSRLASSQNNLATFLRECGKLDEAEGLFREALHSQEKLAKANPNVPKYHINLGAFCCNFSIFLRAKGMHAESLKWCDKAIETLTKIHITEPRNLTARDYLGNSYRSRAKANRHLKKYEVAMNDWDKAVEYSPVTSKLAVKTERAYSRVVAGQVSEGIAEINELIKSPVTEAGMWYNFACAYSIASGKTAMRKDEYATRAIELLRKAVAVGYDKDDILHSKDKDLDPLRGRDDFSQLIAEVEKQSHLKAK